MLQSILNFEYKERYNSEDFIISPSNKEAFDVLDSWPKSWGFEPYPTILAIVGGRGCGKTHLAHLWKEKSDASFDIKSTGNLIIENINLFDISEQSLFHIFNRYHTSRKFLLLTSSITINKIAFQLPDLASRMKSIREIRIFEPDDYMIKMILFRHFSTRAIKVEENVINYLTKILPRNFHAISEEINLLDQMSLIHKKDITIPFIKKTLNHKL
jgi:chromosomal replication initiation ATPase DnaA